jgi:hypothetical protein
MYIEHMVRGKEKKPRGSDAKLARLHALRNQLASAETTQELRRYLADASSLIVAEAARILKDQTASALAGDLVAAFDRLMIEPEESDKQCRAKIEIVAAANDFLIGLIAGEDPSARAALSALAIHRENPKITASIAAAVEANGAPAVREWFSKKFPAEV